MKKLFLLIFFCSCVSIKKYNNLKRSLIPAREYQLDIDGDSIYLYDGNKYIGSCTWDDIGSLFLKDNL